MDTNFKEQDDIQPRMVLKTRDQLEVELEVDKRLDEEREKSDSRYAAKIVETAMFGFIGVLLLAVVGAILKTVIGCGTTRSPLRSE